MYFLRSKKLRLVIRGDGSGRVINHDGSTKFGFRDLKGLAKIVDQLITR